MSTLGQRARSAVLWNAGFNLFRDLVQFGVMLVLVRMLPAESYGQFGFVTSVVGFLAIFSYNHFVAHSLQVREEEATNYQAHFTAGAVMNITMFILANAVALGMRWSSTWSSAAPFLHAVSITFLLEWPCELRRKIIERQLDWRKLRILHGLGLILNAILAISMAALGCGTYALLIPGLAVTLPFIYDLFVRQGWRPQWTWSYESYKPALKFGLTRIGSGLTMNGRQMLESAMLSSVLGFAALGVLNRSTGLAQLFCYKLASQLVYAIYPLLTRIEGPASNPARVNGLVLRTVAWAVIPTAVVFSVLTGPVVRTVYGEKWMAVAGLLTPAMAWGAASALVHVAYMLLLSRQQQGKCLFADGLNFGLTAACLLIALPYGPFAYLTSIAISQVVLAGLVMFWLVRYELIQWSAIGAAVVPASLATGSAAIASVAIFSSVRVQVDTFLTAFAWGGLFLTLYVALLRLCFAMQLAALIRYFPARNAIFRMLLLPPAL